MVHGADAQVLARGNMKGALPAKKSRPPRHLERGTKHDDLLCELYGGVSGMVSFRIKEGHKEIEGDDVTFNCLIEAWVARDWGLS